MIKCYHAERLPSPPTHHRRNQKAPCKPLLKVKHSGGFPMSLRISAHAGVAQGR